MSQFKIDTDSPHLGLQLSADPSALKEGEYTFLLNGTMHGLEGKAPFLRMMAGNKLRASLPAGYYPVCQEPVNHKEICVFSVQPGSNNSEIGLFDGKTYKTVVNDVRLGFNIRKQIQAVVDEDFNGHKIIQWVQQDAPIRYMDLNNPPMINGFLDLDALTVFKKYTYPQVSLIEVTNNGRLLAGSLYVTTQYADENGNGLTGWSTPKGPAFIYRDAISQPKNFINGSPDREPTGKALKIEVGNLDQSFKFYNVGIIKSYAGVREAFVVATLPVVQTNYLYTGSKVGERAIDIKDIETPAVSYSSAKTIARSSGSILIGNLKGRKEYNLQPFVNKIQLQWQTVKEKYDTAEKTYANPLSGAYTMSLRRNEIYSFGLVIRWTDGTTSRVYPLIGREKNLTTAGDPITLTADAHGRAIPAGEWDTYKFPASDDIYETAALPERWKPFNTAYKSGSDIGANLEGPADYGEFGYWESTDNYPNDKRIWGNNAGKPIRHFMAPDPAIAPLTDGENMFKNDKDISYIYKLAMRFPNINEIIRTLPAEIKDQMEGWEIVRADRRTSKSVIASGLLYNMRYQNWREGIPGGVPTGQQLPGIPGTTIIGGGMVPKTDGEDDMRLFQNYPLNDLRPDKSMLGYPEGGKNVQEHHDQYRKDIFSFVSPDTEFDKTMLLNGELQLHYENYGVSRNTISMVRPYPNLKHNAQDDDFREIFYHHIAVGHYNNYKLTKAGTLRRKLSEAMYIPFNSQVAGGNTGMPVHNLWQEHSVLLQVHKDIENPSVEDTSRVSLSDPDYDCKNIANARYRAASAYYGSIVARLDNQYGGVYDTKYIGTNLDNSNVKDDVPVFGGDTFMGAFGTKRQHTTFQNAQSFISFPDGSRGIDLKNSFNISGFKYFYTSVSKWIADNSNSECEPRGLGTKYISMLQTGVPIFITESDHNMDLQLNGGEKWATFHPNLKDGSLTLNKWAGIEHIDKPNEHLVNIAYEEANDLYAYQNPDPFYNPDLNEVNHYSTRVIFSLTNSAENRFNNILVFSPLNYYDFRRDAGELWDIRDMGNNRILFRLEHALYMDRKYATIPVEGDKIQLGTGKLFETEPQHITKTDSGYLGTRSQWAFNSTPFGSFFIDSLRSAVIQFGEGPNDIAPNGVDSYLMENMPLALLKDFPWFKDYDNPANPEGIGFTSVYDHFNKLWILTKRDYEVIDKSITSHFRYDADGKLELNGRKVSLSDGNIFANKSFTFCYSPMAQRWVGWASFIPTSYGVLQKEYFSFSDGGLWEHNKGLPRTFYGKRYPFIFEGVVKHAGGDSMLHSCSWITRAFPILKDVQQGESFLHTFNKGVFYNLQMSTGEIKLTVQDENDLSTLFDPEEITTTSIERYLRRRERMWQVAELYDLVVDHNIPLFTTEYAKTKAHYFIDKVVNHANIDYTRAYDQSAPLNDLWMKYRLTFDRDEDIQIYMYVVLALNELTVV